LRFRPSFCPGPSYLLSGALRLLSTVCWCGPFWQAGALLHPLLLHPCLAELPGLPRQNAPGALSDLDGPALLWGLNLYRAALGAMVRLSTMVLWYMMAREEMTVIEEMMVPEVVMMQEDMTVPEETPGPTFVLKLAVSLDLKVK